VNGERLNTFWSELITTGKIVGYSFPCQISECEWEQPKLKFSLTGMYPSDSNSTQLRITESQQKCSSETLTQHLFRLLSPYKSKNRTIHPRTPQMLPGQFHDGVEPFPKRKVFVWERFLAELRPSQLVRMCWRPEMEIRHYKTIKPY
jgi:hypothetical protein